MNKVRQMAFKKKGQQKYFQLKPRKARNIQGSFGMGDFQRENSGIS